MKAADLRKSILQAAVQGKLVPQNPHDEPATTLLERIRKEKSQLIKKGKIKKEKPLPPITEDEIPYDLPDRWAWCRLGEVISLVSGRDLDLPQINGKNFGIPYITGASAIHNGRVLITRWTEHSCSTSECGDLLVTCKGTVGKMAFNNVGKLHIARQIMAIRFFSNSLSSEYIKTYIESYVHKLHILAKSIIPGIAREDLLTLPIPLPPLAEQQRIVVAVNGLMAFCDELEAAEKELDTLESNFAEYLPKSILQAAVQGKLVPQNIHDEPADKLLERIKAEKAKLIKSGKLKKEKPLPPITEDEIPYDLPDGWVWCRLGEICSKIGSGSTPRGGRDVYVSSGIPFLRSQNIRNEGVTLAGAAYITEQIHTKMCNTTVQPCDILLNITGASLGRCALVPDKFPTANVSQHVTIIRLCDNEIRNFIHKLFIAPQYQQLIWERQVGMAREGLSKKKLEMFEVPLPPLAEQQRIVAKVNELMALCDALKAAHETPVGNLTAAKVIPFPQPEADPEMLMAARGKMPKAPSKALQDARNRLLGD